MSNIYDSANELSRGLRELPEYKAVKAAKDAIAADAEASKIFQNMLPFKRKFKNWHRQVKCQMLPSKLRWKALVNRFRGITSYQNSLPSNNNWQFTFLTLKKIVFEPDFRIAKIRNNYHKVRNF